MKESRILTLLAGNLRNPVKIFFLGTFHLGSIVWKWSPLCHLCQSIKGTLANRVHPDQTRVMARAATFDQGQISWKTSRGLRVVAWTRSVTEKDGMLLLPIITKTRLFKYIENFTSKNWKFSDKKLLYFSYFCSKHRLLVLVRTSSMYIPVNPSFSI